MKKIILIASSIIATSVASSQSFSGVDWDRWTDNSPEQDKTGSGNCPSTSGATNNTSDEYTFAITTSSTSSTQRQEWKYDRQDGYTKFQLRFKINSTHNGDDYEDFDKISLIQCHDDQTGSEGVFSIYQVRQENGRYYFGVQGDTTDASNGYSTFDTAEIKLDTWYKITIRTYTDGDNDSYETAQLRRDSDNVKIWEETIEEGGDVESYYKIGVYKLSGGNGKVSATFKKMKFWEGSK